MYTQPCWVKTSLLRRQTSASLPQQTYFLTCFKLICRLPANVQRPISAAVRHDCFGRRWRCLFAPRFRCRGRSAEQNVLTRQTGQGGQSRAIFLLERDLGYLYIGTGIGNPLRVRGYRKPPPFLDQLFAFSVPPIMSHPLQPVWYACSQTRQRECVTVISLGCVAALFVKHVSGDYNGTIPVMVTFIPLLVHLLLVRDIYVKWESR